MNDSEKARTLRWPEDPAILTVEGVDFEAVAHMLANTCCWSGRSRRFYSLAQHAVTVSAAVERLGGMNEKDRRVLSLHALLADAWRAWLPGQEAVAPSAKPEKKWRDISAVQRTVGGGVGAGGAGAAGFSRLWGAGRAAGPGAPGGVAPGVAPPRELTGGAGGAGATVDPAARVGTRTPGNRQASGRGTMAHDS